MTAQTLAGVAAEEQVIVFGERVWCLGQLARTLRERHGVEAHVADGSITTGEFETLKRRFTADEFPVLCLSRIGHEGHNLQNASVLCHLDLPWLPNGLAQRVGRAARPGAARGHVQTYIPYIRRGGIEHVVSVLAARGAEHHPPLLSALTAQAAAVNKLAWPAVRPVLSALRDYWMDGGFSIHGIQMPALLLICPPELRDLFTATVRALVSSGYLESTGVSEDLCRERRDKPVRRKE